VLNSSSQPDQRIETWTGEFATLAVEQQYLHAIAPVQRATLRVTALVGAAIFLSFAVTDFLALGAAPLAWTLLGLRAGVALGALAAASDWLGHRVGRSPSYVAVTCAEILASAVFCVIVAARPAEFLSHQLSLALMVLAYFLFIPNRFRYSLAVTVLLVAGYASVSWWTGGVLRYQWMTPLLALATFGVIGAVAAARMNRSRRVEFLSRMALNEAIEGLQSEIVWREDLQRELTWIADHDSLTELLNRRSFLEAAEIELQRARRYSDPLSIVLLDIDNFKEINDEFGHLVGDTALREAAVRCAGELRIHDIGGRVGGDEFAFVIVGAQEAEADQVAHRIRQAISSRPIALADGAVTVSASLGFAVVDVEHEGIEAALHRADQAMYTAKRAGRNQVVASSK
jgi:diguanylate cyclase (GGDEF)-like protein